MTLRRKSERHVNWKKDLIVLIPRELAAVVQSDWTGPGKYRKRQGIFDRVMNLLPSVSHILVGIEVTEAQLREHIRKTQDGREFRENALYQRGDKLPRYNEFSPVHEYVAAAYRQVIREPIRKNFTKKMISERLAQCGKRCEYRGCDLIIAGGVADHFIPVARGGDGSYDNLRIACVRCNQEKSDTDPFQFMKKIELERSRGRKHLNESSL